MQKLRQNINIVGKNLKRLRKQTGLTQEQTAAKLQTLGLPTSRSVYSRYETGELNIPISDIMALKNIFNCSYDDFFKTI